MFEGLFGKAPELPALVGLGNTDVTLRRTDAEVLSLVKIFQDTISQSDSISSRVAHFWPTPEFLDRVLFAVGGQIPRGQNPLQPRERNEIFPDEGGNEEEELDDETRIKRKAKNKAPICVEWLGPVNAQNGYAAIPVQIPATAEAWITWTNRIVTFLFAEIPHYAIPEDFLRILGPPEGGPFPMRCRNPRCVRLAHIAFPGVKGSHQEDERSVRFEDPRRGGKTAATTGEAGGELRARGRRAAADLWSPGYG